MDSVMKGLMGAMPPPQNVWTTTAHASSVCISVPLWQIRIFGLFFHAKSGYPDFIRIFFVQVRIGPYILFSSCK